MLFQTFLLKLFALLRRNRATTINMMNTRLEPDRQLVHAARLGEIEYMNTLGVWEVLDRNEATKNGERVIGTRWVTSSKGDARNIEIRARLVVQETKRLSSIAPCELLATFAATPRLEALRLSFSLVMIQDLIDEEDWVIVILDISRAHPHCKMSRRVLVEFLKECGFGANKVALLPRCLHGARDAAQAFEKRVAEIDIEIGATQGLFSPFHASTFTPASLRGPGFTATISLCSCRGRVSHGTATLCPSRSSLRCAAC